MINPNQSFKVRRQSQLSYLQMQSLTQLYQPIIGGPALSLYLTLHSLPINDGLWTHSMLHAQILETLNTGINAVDASRIRLEGIGLLRTYQDTQSHSQSQLQQIIYDLQMPVDAAHFFDHPQLSNALFQAIGDQEYRLKVKSWQVDKMDSSRFKEITSSFTRVYNYLTVGENTGQEWKQEDQFLRHQDSDQHFKYDALDFDYGKFLELLMANQVDHQEFNQVLKDHVLTCYQLYGLNEATMAEVVLLSRHPIQHHIQIDRIKQIAKQRLPQTIKSSNSTNTSESTSHPPKDTDQVAKDYQQKYPQLSAEEIELVMLFDQVSNDAFLYNVKKQKKGFATDREYYYIKQLVEKSDLTPAVLNSLIYYLLVVLNRDNILKGELENVANHWSQMQIKDPGMALTLIQREEKVKQIKEKQQIKQSAPSKNFRRRSQHQEVIPAWMKQKGQESTQSSPAQEPAGTLDEKTLQERIQKIMGKEGHPS
ncbi:hypothetical protein [Ignavigranum ruoffiae]|uniref:hypothetical protein n=1 Tax=Ignavigranum ruoffiae TaxID=89093 RepID=UPI0024AD0707|nr:hypothetical protein [Ignavigranum ruoffiae]